MPADTAVHSEKAKAVALPNEGYCSIKALAQPDGVTPWAESTLWLRVRQGRFPAPERFGARCTRWRVELIREYLADPNAWEATHAPVNRPDTASPSAKGKGRCST
ncbi:MAG: hypothetical protein E2576_24115 [Alcaligenaceae bacterium]|nr:hypothetical protein [Alcaligenaceae bacterium SAGV5]MPS54692.1 hypothetical protein [Alcaligenaceae bacterium SAGV3]MPT59822.1 hypothetical protein [Alcaligenaceae bacterium]